MDVLMNKIDKTIHCDLYWCRDMSRGKGALYVT